MAKRLTAKIAVIVFLLLQQTLAFAQNERRYPWQYFWQQSLAAYKNKKPSDADIDQAMADNICRCGTYQRIRNAIHRAAKNMKTRNSERP